jgi:hypothetical protein
MLSQTVQHPVVIYIVAAIVISKTCLLYQNYGFGIIIIIIIIVIIMAFWKHKIQEKNIK